MLSSRLRQLFPFLFFEGRIITIAVVTAALILLVVLINAEAAFTRLAPDKNSGVQETQSPAVIIPACVLPPFEMVAWYPGDGNALDIQGGNTATLQNGAGFGPGKVAQAFSFDGVDDFVEVADNSAASVTGSLTIDAWISLTTYPTGNNFSPIVSKWSPLSVGAKHSYLLSINRDGNLRLIVSNASGFGAVQTSGFNSVPLNALTHVTGVFDSGAQVARLYINGVEKAVGSIPISSIADNDEPLLIGATDYEQFVNTRQFAHGLIDEVEIFKRALSQSEIQSIVNADSAGKCKPMSNDWNATSGVLPDRTCPPYNLFDDAEPETPVLSANKLTLSTSHNNELMFYQQTAPYISFSDATFIEARTRVVSGSSNFVTREHAGIIFLTATAGGNSLFIGQDEVFLLAEGDVRGMTAAVDTDDAFHTYRINIQPDGSINVLYDGSLILTGSTFPQGGGLPQIAWGDFTNEAQGISEWEFFRHNAGRGSPPDCPTLDPAFVVSNTNDNGLGSLRQAILNANSTSGAQIITFNIPGSGVHTIAPLSNLPEVTDSVTINGYSQPGASVNTLAQGNDAVLLIELNGSNVSVGLDIRADNCTVRGLIVNRAIGSVGIDLWSRNNLVEGNFIGTDATGNNSLGNANGVRVISSVAANNTIGGTTPAARNVISGNRFYGVITGFNPPGTRVQGNYIGTNASGTALLANGLYGVSVESSDNLIGGTMPGAGNVIAGGEVCVELRSWASFVQGNFIGTLADGITAAGSHNVGVQISGSNNVIGGTESGSGNTIAFAQRIGVGVTGGSGNFIFGNSIFGNNGIGIDLGGDGVTQNDSGDTDEGANHLQNFPTLGVVSNSGINLTIQGTLISAANTTFNLQFFTNVSCDPSGYGEGQTTIGTTPVTTNANGEASFTASFPVALPQDQFVTATATDPANNTSEFSPCRPMTSTTPPDLQVAALSGPSQAFTDVPFDLSWTTTNAGQEPATGPWADRVLLSTDALIGNDTLLGDFLFTPGLAAGASADRIQSINIPRAAVPADGQYYLIVLTDADNNVPEGSAEGNNSRVFPLTVSRALLPDLIVESIEAPDTAFFDQTITVRWTVKNNGNASTNASQWHDELFLSSDHAPSADDPVQLMVLNVSYLDVGERYIASAEVKIPRGLTNTYYLIVKTDADGQALESDENNNTFERPVSLQVPPLPDLQVSLVQGPEEGFTGQPMQLNWRVENRGTGNTPVGQGPWMDGIYLSQDQTLNTQTDRFIGSRDHSGGLAQNDGYTVSNFSVNIPNDIAGDWYVFVVADSQDKVYEFTGENNNSNFDQRHAIHIHATPPDLIVPSVSALPNGTANQQITVNWTVQNQGAFDANANWIDTIYLSADATLDPTSDRALASVPQVRILGPGMSYSSSATVRLPACINGPYFLFVFTDNGKQVFEYDPNIDAESNNFSSARAIQVANMPPDLVVTVLSNPPSGVAGQPVSLNWTVSNQGTGATVEGFWIDRVYISFSATLDGTGILVSSFSHAGELAPGAAYTRTENVTIPTTAQGTYKVFVVTDAGNTVSECGGDNNNVNSGSTPLTVSNSLPDLTVTSVNTPLNALAGQTVPLQWSLMNTGTAATPASALKDTVYFSNDNVLDQNDKLLATTLSNGPLAAGVSYAVNTQATIPAVPAGSYYIIVKADSDNFVFEGLHEDNNTNYTTITITVAEVDLETSAVSAPPDGFSGQAVSVSWMVTNAGPRQTFASQWTDRILLSHDQILDATDPVIGFKVHEGALAAGGGYNATVNAEVPPGLTGSYYVYVLSDVHQQVAEANEVNNVGVSNAVAFQLPPPVDLHVTAVNAPASGSPGEAANIQWTIQNIGSNTATGNWTDAVYLSVDGAWDITDAPVGRADHTGPLAPGASYAGTLNVALPAVNPGPYFVIVRTDVRNRVREIDDANNATASSAPMSVDVTELALGVPRITTLQTGQERFYKTNAPANETLLYTLDAQHNDSATEMFARQGAMPSRSVFDFLYSRPGEADQEIVVPNTIAGPYYNLTRGEYISPLSGGTTPITIKAEIVPFSIRSVSPQRIGDNGQVTLTIKGARFQDGATVQLVGNGTTLTASKVTVLDSATVKARFIFTNAPHGTYDVVLTNPINATVSAIQAVTIEAAARLIVELNVSGNTNPRVGGALSLDAVLRNMGNVDVPYVAVKTKFGADVSVVTRRPAGTLPRHADMNGSESAKYLFTNVKIGSTTTDVFLVRNFEVGHQIEFQVGATGFSGRAFRANLSATPLSTNQYLSILRAAVEDARQVALDQPSLPLIPELAAKMNDSEQWWAAFRQAYVAIGYIDSDASTLGAASSNGPSGRNSPSNEGCPGYSACRYTFIGAAGGCVVAFLFGGPPACVAGAVGASALVCGTQVVDNQNCPDDEPEPVMCETWSDCTVTTVNGPGGTSTSRSCKKTVLCPVVPRDPNDKVGAAGFSPQAFVSVQQKLPYTINFENVSTATAAAQRIRITDQLDPNLDWRTFRLKEIGFGAYHVTVPENRAFYQTRLQLGPDLGNLLADITARLDIATGQVTWTLTAIDPATGEQPNGALQGLLPPNDSTARGQGFMSYTVKPKSTAVTGSQIANQATIIFDTEEPITTNTVTNTLDADLPTSAVNALPATQAQTTFTFSWTGSDPPEGSGLQSFDIWVSENEAPYQPFLSGTTDTSAQFTGQTGRAYRFYSIAHDNAGNVEAAPETADAVTTIAVPTATAALLVNDVSINEENTGASSATFIVTMYAASNEPVTVNYATADGTATAGSDYIATSGRVSFAAGETVNAITVMINGDTVVEGNETFFVNLSNATNAILTDAQGVATILDNDNGTSGIQFSAASYNINEDGGAATIAVTRTGDTSDISTVNVATNDSLTFSPCNATTVTASPRCDYTATSFTLTFASGETTKSFAIPIADDAYVEGNETVSLVLSNAVGTPLGTPNTATLIISDNDSAPPTANPLDTVSFFVGQHYADFLNRASDPTGLDFWTRQITDCGSDQACLQIKRTNVSAAFFLSIEFQETGYLVYRTYKAAYGNLADAPVPLRLVEFLPDTQQIGRGVVVGQTGWAQILENNKQIFARNFVARSRFTSAYPTTLTPASFVDALYTNAGVTPAAVERSAAIDEFGGASNTADTPARERALRRVAENSTLKQQEFNKAFVLMQYFGYLRRNPNGPPEPMLDFAGYNFWLTKLNRFNGNFVNAEMVKAFIVSSEYRQRFGP